MSRARMGRSAGALALAVLAGAAAPGTARTQSPEALLGTTDGVVALTYPTRPGTRICGEGGHDVSLGRGVRVERGQPWGSEGGCREGSAIAQIAIESGEVVDVRLLGPDERVATGARDLGRVSGSEGARFFLDLARSDAPASDEAILAAVLADSVVVWPDLLDLAEDRARPSRTRKSALFWLGQEAAATVTEALVSTAGDVSEDEEIRDAAVFALSQRPEEESLPALMKLAREAEHADTRRSALFWLAQSSDPRVPEFFADILGSPW